MGNQNDSINIDLQNINLKTELNLDKIMFFKKFLLQKTQTIIDFRALLQAVPNSKKTCLKSWITKALQHKLEDKVKSYKTNLSELANTSVS